MHKRSSFFKCFLAVVGAASLLSGRADAQPADPLVALRLVDERVATIGHRLATGAVDLCAEPRWLPGFAVHHLSQYGTAFRPRAASAFGLGAEPAVLALAQGGAAARAGVRADDKLLRIEGTPVPAAPPRASGFAYVEQVLALLDRAFEDGEAELVLRRGGSEQVVRIRGDRGCASLFQVLWSNRMNALADGRVVQVTSALVAYAGDDQQLAAVLAHELAHNVAGHRVRLDAQRVRRGFLGNFGRNAQRIRATEIEADRLSIYLLDRAGFDPEAAVRFWTRFGRRALNILGSPTHSNPATRLALFRTEIDKVRRARAAGGRAEPDFLALPPAAAEVR